MAHQPVPDTQAPPRRDRTHYLYVAVIVAVLAGVLVGLVAPDFAVRAVPARRARNRTSATTASTANTWVALVAR